MAKKLLVVVALIVFLSGCDNDTMGGGGMMGGRGMMGTIDIPGQQPPQETNADYVKGYRQAKMTCTQCHAMPHPAQHSGEAWPGVIARMKGHIQTYKKTMPSQEELKSIVEYYVGNSG
ncbi:hypothetical protein MNBD_GAMMA19-1243 [hydrothermal vent metagenome]|uniref:Cytochrome c domain-containing protein n=1 Tax=hydrothermal vent metagenome TaxID=652676 RepID=A0A3B0ZXC2_9ZZZZ